MWLSENRYWGRRPFATDLHSYRQIARVRIQTEHRLRGLHIDFGQSIIVRRALAPFEPHCILLLLRYSVPAILNHQNPLPIVNEVEFMGDKLFVRSILLNLRDLANLLMVVQQQPGTSVAVEHGEQSLAIYIAKSKVVDVRRIQLEASAPYQLSPSMVGPAQPTLKLKVRSIDCFGATNQHSELSCLSLYPVVFHLGRGEVGSSGLSSMLFKIFGSCCVFTRSRIGTGLDRRQRLLSQYYLIRPLQILETH